MDQNLHKMINTAFAAQEEISLEAKGGTNSTFIRSTGAYLRAALKNPSAHTPCPILGLQLRKKLKL